MTVQSRLKDAWESYQDIDRSLHRRREYPLLPELRARLEELRDIAYREYDECRAEARGVAA